MLKSKLSDVVGFSSETLGVDVGRLLLEYFLSQWYPKTESAVKALGNSETLLEALLQDSKHEIVAGLVKRAPEAEARELARHCLTRSGWTQAQRETLTRAAAA